jgi:hypothetical protein
MCVTLIALALMRPVLKTWGAAAQVEEFAVAEERDGLARRDVGQALDLVAPLVHGGDEAQRLLARDLGALELLILGDDRLHLRLDLRKILGREAVGHLEVVVEALVGGGADVELDLGAEQTPDRRRQHMRRAMAHAIEITRRIKLHRDMGGRRYACSERGRKIGLNPRPVKCGRGVVPRVVQPSCRPAAEGVGCAVDLVPVAQMDRATVS